MKIRGCFVSNSSSSSFILLKRYLTSEQIEACRDPLAYLYEHYAAQRDEYAARNTSWDSPHDPALIEGLDLGRIGEAWRMEECLDAFSFSTWMDNFDMYAFLELIDVPREAIVQEWHS